MPTPAQNFLLYRGGKFPSSVPVVCGRDIKRKSGGVCFWEEGSACTRRRRDPIRAIVLHHTAGEGNGTAVFNTLVKRRLSVHFTIDADGRIIQHADIDTVTFHGGETNGWTVGIEITNRGVPPSMPKRHREVVQCMVHGRRRPMLKFTPAQVTSTKALVKDLCELLQLPFNIPRNTDHSPITTTVAPEILTHWRGVLGHLHFKHTKIDPVPHIFDEVFDAA